MKMKYSVVVLDNHSLLLEAIACMVNSFDKFTVLYTCKNKTELIEKLKPSNIKPPNIIIVNIKAPIIKGIEVIKWVSKNHPESHILAISTEDKDAVILKILKAGALGYLLKNTKKDILEQTLLDIMENGFYHTKNTTSLLLESITKKTSNKSIHFKDNELIFMRLACSELTYKEIASQMFLSPKTIDGYRDSLFTKLNVKNRVGMVIYAIKNNIYTP